MISGAVFPHSFGGIVGAVMLGLGRAMGETIAVALVIGSVAADHRRTSSSPATRCRRSSCNQFGESRGTFRVGAHRPRRGAVRHHHPRQPRRPGRRAAGPRSGMRGAGMTATDRSTDRRRPLDLLDRAGRAAAAGSRDRPRHRRADRLSFVVAARPARPRRRLRRRRRASAIISWDVPHRRHPASAARDRPGHGPGDRRHAAHHRRGRADGDPARRARRDLPQRVRQARRRWPGSSASWPTS